MSATETDTKPPKEPKDLRYRNQYFPGAEALVFDTKRKGFIPLSILYRKLLGHLSPPAVRILIYLALRASKYGICYPTLEEIAHDLRLSGKKQVTPQLRKLEEKRFIATRTGGGKKFFLIHDPRVAVEHLGQTGELSESDLYEINDLLKDLGQEPIVVTPTASSKVRELKRA